MNFSKSVNILTSYRKLINVANLYRTESLSPQKFIASGSGMYETKARSNFGDALKGWCAKLEHILCGLNKSAFSSHWEVFGLSSFLCCDHDYQCHGNTWKSKLWQPVHSCFISSRLTNRIASDSRRNFLSGKDGGMWGITT